MRDNTTTTSRQYILDTNVLISDPQCLYKFDEHDIILPMTVIEELDNLKSSLKSERQGVSREARIASQNIKQITNGHGAQLSNEGVRIAEGAGLLKVVNDNVIEEKGLPTHINDNKIILCALHLQKKSPEKKTVLVTKDTNCLLKGFAAGLKHVEDYENDQQIDDIDYLPTGYYFLDSNFMESLKEVESNYDNGPVYTFKKSELPDDLSDEVYLNQYLIIEDSDFVFVVEEVSDTEVKAKMMSFKRLGERNAFGILPRNRDQAIALEALLDPEIDMVQLTGPAGSGKTLLAVAAAIEQSRMGSAGGRHKAPLYDKIIVTRNTPDMAESIGFLPGTEEEKMMPWLAAFTDTLDVLIGPKDTEGNTDDKFNAKEGLEVSVNMIKEQARFQFKSLNFMRGRSIQRSFVILDEAQNLTPYQMKSIVSRMGEGTKLVVLGNLGQIDAKYITPLTSGLTHAVMSMKNYEGSSLIALPGGERSRLASYAENNL